MKILNFIIVASCIFLASCTKSITGLNTNTKAASNVPSVTLFTYGEKALVDDYTTTSVSVAPFRVIAQEWTENSYTYEAVYNFAAYQPNNGWWNALYQGVLANLQAAKIQFPKDVLDPAAAANDVRIADILEVYAYDLLVNTYGNIPYTEALNPSIPFPKYDDAKTIYTDLLTRLDTCIAGLNTSAASLGSADLIYGGDITQWKKFAASLKLKMAVRLIATDASTASSKITEAIATGIFASNSDNATLPYDPSSPSNSNPLWQALVYSGRHDFVPANLLVTTMVGLNDPRLPLYFQQYNGGYSGGIPGNGNGYGAFSDFSAQMQQPDYPGIILGYWQTQFWLAEAAASGIAVGGTVEQHYDSAITASIEYWGGSAADAATYLAQPSVAYATATGSWQQKLGYQEWIADYNMNWDAWTDIRRLGYPDIDVISPPVGAHGNFPLRFTYPSNESASNSVNEAAAVAALSGGMDVVSAKLFWMP
jgi:hypothetical protein